MSTKTGLLPVCNYLFKFMNKAQDNDAERCSSVFYIEFLEAATGGVL